MVDETILEIIDPSGARWRVGDKVSVAPGPYQIEQDAAAQSAETEISHIYPGNGSWEREQPDGDIGAVWFAFTNGSAARPWLVTKLKN